MVNLLGLWMLLFAILLGWGLFIIWLLRRYGGAAFAGALGMFQTAWLGYAALHCFLQLVSFAIRINNLAFALSCVPAAAGLTLYRHVIVRRVGTAWAQRRRLTLVTAIVIALVMVVVG